MPAGKWVGVAISAHLLASCAFGPQMQRAAIDQNAMIADTANELTLVNILRARDREPLHFTSISKATGSATLTGTAGGSVPITGPSRVRTTDATGAVSQIETTGVEVYTPALEASIVAGSTLDIAIFDTQEFYQGITTSVTASQIAHYLHQGWPPELLTYLMVEAVEFIPDGVSPATVETVWRNDPEDHAEMGRFAHFVHCYPLEVGVLVPKENYLVPLSALSQPGLTDFLQVDGSRFDVVDRKVGDKNERWLVRRGEGGDTVTISPASQHCNFDEKVGEKIFSIRPTAATQDYSGHPIFAEGTATVNGITTPGRYQLVLRSVEGTIYYLGETLRPGATMPKLPGRGGRLVPLLSVSETRPDQIFIQARFRRQNWFVPHDPDVSISRTSQAIGLVQQLVNLQKLSQDKPATQSIRIVQ